MARYGIKQQVKKGQISAQQALEKLSKSDMAKYSKVLPWLQRRISSEKETNQNKEVVENKANKPNKTIGKFVPSAKRKKRISKEH